MAPVMMNVVSLAKVVLHACKYPHGCVNGILLSSKDNHQEIIDAVPLFHCNIPLLPMLEASLYQIEAYCAAQNLGICGYYQVSDKLHDYSPNVFAQKIGEKICETVPDACILMVRNDLIDRDCADNPVICFHQIDGKWKESANPKLEDGALERTATLLHTKAYRGLVDFDNHLDDLTLDWRNSHITKNIAQMS